ncbi:MAG: copper chaperone PCu(A)C [Pseudorhodobacter sp.]
MTMNTLFAAASAAFLAMVSAPLAFAGDITITDPYLRVSGAMATSAAAFMTIENSGAEDRLIDVHSDLAKKVELHTHLEDANGVMKMVHVAEGFVIAAGEKHMLMRGGEHVMFLGLNSVPVQGDTISLTLRFEKAGDMTIDVPVDNERAAGKGAGMMDHSKMGHGMKKEAASN